MLQSNGNQIGKFFKLPNPDLMAYFGRVKRGNSSIIETPFGESETTQQLLKSWLKELIQIKDAWPTLLDYELEMMSKVGPLSYMEPLTNRMDDILKYYNDIKGNHAEINPRAIKAVINEFKCISGIIARSPEKTLKQMKLSTNSGNPDFTKRSVIAEQLHSWSVLKASTEWVQIINDETWGVAALLGWRGQEGGPLPTDVKQRVVFMFPFIINLAELMIYQPLIESVQRFNLIPAYVSMDQVDRTITNLFNTNNGENIMCTDFTSFDSHFNGTLQNASLSIFKSLLTNNESNRRWLEVVYPIKYYIPLVLSEKAVLYGHHGMGSGSGGTNFDETIAHRALQYEAAQSIQSRLNTNSMCLGDDGLLSYPGITPEQVIEVYSSHGLEMNETKQYFDRSTVIYLRRWHNRQYLEKGVNVGVYPTMRALGRMRYQERYYKHWSSKMVALRQLSILENIKYHPLKERFVDFCMKRDRYRLGLDIPGFLSSIDHHAKEATAYMPDFLGYTKSIQTKTEPSTWWIVKYLQSQR